MTDRLNIALLSIHSCPYAVLGSKDTGGMNVYIRELSRELTDKGHRVDIYTASHTCGHCSLMQPGGADLNIMHLANSICPNSSLSEVRQQAVLLSSEIDSLQQQNEYKYDLIHSHYWQSGIVGNHLRKMWDIPHISMFHTLSSVKKLLNAENIDPAYRAEIEKEIMECSDCIVASTLREKYYMQTLYGIIQEKIKVIPCGINMELFSPVDFRLARDKTGLNRDEKIALFVGRLEPLKGIDRLLEGLSRIKNVSPVKLLVLGGDENSRQYRTRLEQYAADLGITDRVSFKGSVLQSELSAYYSAADITIVPSYYESFGLVLLESLACGTPVLTTNVGAAGDVIMDTSTGKILNGNSPADIATGILEYTNSSNSKKQSSLYRKAVDRYNWNFISDLIITEYRSLIENRVPCESVN